MTHKKRDCLERPRKIGAKFTNSNFAPDEFIQPNLSLSFDGKRDRWNGYDNFAHQVSFTKQKKIFLFSKRTRLFFVLRFYSAGVFNSWL
jgi:pre-mRNA-processing factor SLU7